MKIYEILDRDPRTTPLNWKLNPGITGAVSVGAVGRPVSTVEPEPPSPAPEDLGIASRDGDVR
ncbi:MAG: hypothetical protein ACE10E_13275, partial [Acidiferrobacterales bacterium]